MPSPRTRRAAAGGAAPRRPRLADRRRHAEASLALARSRQPIADAAAGLRHDPPARVLAAATRSEAAHAAAATAPATARAAGPGRRRLDDDDDDDDDDLGHLLSSPVGGGGAVGRLLGRLLSPVAEAGRRRSAGRGRPDARRPAGAPEPDVDVHVVEPSAPCARRRRPTPRHGAVLPGVGRAPAPLPARLVHGDRERRAGRRRARPRRCPTAVALRRPLARLGIGLTRCRRQRRATTSTSTPRSRRGSTPWPGRRTTTTSTSRACAAAAISPSSSCSTSRAPPASPAPAAGRCTSTSGRWRRRSPPRSTTSATGSRSTPSTRVAGGGAAAAGQGASTTSSTATSRGGSPASPRRRTRASAPPSATAAAILEERGGTPRRLLVVLSDGFAYDHGYEGRYGEADAAALVEARRRGVGCLCLSVGADADPAALRRVFGTAAHATVPTPEQLPRDRPAVPRGAALGGSAAARVPAQGTDAGAPRDRAGA